MKKMLFIINPRSGKEQIRSRLLEILDSFVKAGYGPSVYITQGPKDAEYQAARAKTKELVVCSGGDGTLNEVISRTGVPYSSAPDVPIVMGAR